MRGWRPEHAPTNEEYGLASLPKEEGNEVLGEVREALDTGDLGAAEDVMAHLRYLGRRAKKKK